MFQSANINFFIGSGASLPAIQVLGTIENDLQKLIEDEKQDDCFILAATFLTHVWLPHNCMLGRGGAVPFGPDVTKNLARTRKNYETFIASLEKILTWRRTGLLPRRINVFTTNYDLFIEEAATHNNNIIFNDGFHKRMDVWGNVEFDADILIIP